MEVRDAAKQSIGHRTAPRPPPSPAQIVNMSLRDAALHLTEGQLSVDRGQIGICLSAQAGPWELSESECADG